MIDGFQEQLFLPSTEFAAAAMFTSDRDRKLPVNREENSLFLEQ
jgi:hypothetical protein